MTKGVFGSPRLRGQSEIIYGAVFEMADPAPLVAGKAVSVMKSTKGDQNITVQAFDKTKGFGGFPVANDLGKKTKTVSVVKAGLNIPVPVTTGKTWNPGTPVGLAADGSLVPASDAACVFILNGEVADPDVTAVTADNVEVTGQVAINLGLGGAVKP